MKRKVIMLFCAGALVVAPVALSACADDVECKTCTNSVTKDTYEACGDELNEAMLLPNVSCK